MYPPQPRNGSPDFSIGVDGCRGGWYYVALADGKAAEHGIVPNLAALLRRPWPIRAIFVDIPIGLRNGERRCDAEARTILGAFGRSSSVFSAPCRSAVRAGSYAEANALNRAETGKGLSAQAYGIVPKIREVDDLMLSPEEPRRRLVREVHPEICFWGLAGGRHELGSKKKPEGREKRMALLRTLLDDADRILDEALSRHPAKTVQADDAIDAIVAAVTAAVPETRLKTLPAAPLFDEHGLPMEMVYALPE